MKPSRLALTVLAIITMTGGLTALATPAHAAKPRCTITGTEGNDVIRGTRGRDVICALGGDDTIDSLGGDDLVLAGPGNDSVRTGAGSDRIHLGSGDDVASADKRFAGEPA